MQCSRANWFGRTQVQGVSLHPVRCTRQAIKWRRRTDGNAQHCCRARVRHQRRRQRQRQRRSRRSEGGAFDASLRGAARSGRVVGPAGYPALTATVLRAAEHTVSCPLPAFGWHAADVDLQPHNQLTFAVMPLPCLSGLDRSEPCHQPVPFIWTMLVMMFGVVTYQGKAPFLSLSAS